MIHEAIPESEPKKRNLPRGDPFEANQFFLSVSLFRPRPAETVADRPFVGCQVAHQPKTTEASPGVAAKVDNQPVTISKRRDGAVDVTCNVNANDAREHVDLE